MPAREPLHPTLTPVSLHAPLDQHLPSSSGRLRVDVIARVISRVAVVGPRPAPVLSGRGATVSGDGAGPPDGTARIAGTRTLKR